MAFKDITAVMYDGQIRIEYKDKAHRYFVKELDADGVWGKQSPVRGVTTILGSTLEKSGLQLWPMGLALTELFGFYSFENEKGVKLTGFSKKAKPTLLRPDHSLREMEADQILEAVMSASKAWQRKQKQGSDVGSLVHDAIEQFVLGTPFELTLDKYEEGQLWFDDHFEGWEAERTDWLARARDELEMAVLAYTRFKVWWEETTPTLLEAENIVYSRKQDYSGSYDARLVIPKGKHPVFKDRDVTVMTDWKTSNASVAGNAPMGVYYSYLIQDAAYAAALAEMTGELVDDLLVVSARKDGNFDTIYASELGLTVQDCIDWWNAVVICYRSMDKTKKALVQIHKQKEVA